MASMFQNGISRNTKCAERTIFAEKVTYAEIYGEFNKIDRFLHETYRTGDNAGLNVYGFNSTEVVVEILSYCLC